MKYRKKPLVIDAYKFGGGEEFPEWFLGALLKNEVAFVDGDRDDKKTTIKVQTLEGVMIANNGDYIIRGVKGEIYPCKSDIFEMTYEKVK